MECLHRTTTTLASSQLGPAHDTAYTPEDFQDKAVGASAGAIHGVHGSSADATVGIAAAPLHNPGGGND